MTATTDSGMRVAFNADDFGRSPTINSAVLRAHREGVLTSASLMVTGEAASEAVELARTTPTLAVGLHLVLSDGRPALPPDEIPHLVDERGKLPVSPARSWLAVSFGRRVRAELAREVAAQFERFGSTGLDLSHVDGHQNLHLHPAVFDLVVSLAGRYGAGHVRLPRDELWPSLRRGGITQWRSVGTKVVWAVALGLLCRRASRRLGGLAAPARVFGLLRSGHMDEAYVVDVLRHVARRGGSGLTELYFHPDTSPPLEPWGPNPGDLATLLSPALRRTIKELGLEHRESQ